MARFNNLKNSFRYGEITPKCRTRTELKQYTDGAAEVTNGWVLPQGGISRRPGSQFVKTTFTSFNPFVQGRACRLVPFVVSEQESYVVCLGDGLTEVVNANTGSVATLTQTTTGSFGSGYSQFALADLPNIQFVQIASYLFLVATGHRPQQIVYTGPNAFTLQDFTSGGDFFALLWPFLPINTTSTQISCSGTNGVINIFSSAPLFQTGHEGSVFKITGGSPAATGLVQIYQTLSSTHAVGYAVNTVPTAATAAWEEAAWSRLRGWPRAIAYFQDRVIYGGTSSQPDTIWASGRESLFRLAHTKFAQDGSSDASGLNYFGAEQSTDPFDDTVTTPQANAIQWLASRQVLRVGTTTAEHSAPHDSTTTYSNQNKGTKEETSHGSVSVQPVQVSNQVVFVQKDGQTIRQSQFQYMSQSYDAVDVSVYADHMTSRQTGALNAQFSKIMWSEYNSILWCLDDAGGLTGMTKKEESEALGWHFHKLGGSFTGGANPFITSACLVPSPGKGFQYLWLCVGRLINGSVVYHIERIGRQFVYLTLNDSGATGNEAAIYLDCAISATIGSGTPTANVTGLLTHLIGQTVAVFADGFEQTDKVVDGAGSIVLDQPATNVVIGLRYKTQITTFPIEAGSQVGSARGSIQKIDRETISLYRSAYVEVGPPGKTSGIELRPLNLPFATPTPLFTGDKTVDFGGSPDREQVIQIASDKPLPFTVLGISSRGDTQDG